MPNLDDLRRARATAAQAMATAADALSALEASTTPDAAALTAATAAFDQAEADFKAANTQVQRAESVEAAQAAAAGTGDTRSGAAPVPAAPHEKGLGCAKILRTLAAANGNVFLAQMCIRDRNRIRHGGNPVLAWQVGNVHRDEDAAENVKPNKQKSTGRIDAAVAAIMAVGRAASGESKRRRAQEILSLIRI